VSAVAGIDNYSFALSATVSDLNGDHWPDIYIANDYADKDRLYLNNGNGTFRDALESSLSLICKNSMGCDIADVNNDGLPDIMNLDMMAEDSYRHKQLKGNSPYDMYHLAVKMGNYHQVMRNTLHLNNGNGTFSEIGQLAGVSHTDWSWAPLFADFDNDGRKDLFITNGYYRDVTDMDYLKYDAHEATRKGGGPGKVAKLDLVKMLKSTPVSNYIFRNTGSLTFENKIQDWGIGEASISNGAAVADLDGDGDLEIITNNFNAPSFFFKNNSRELHPENNFLSIRLKGSVSNPFALGAKIYVYTGTSVQFQEVSGNRGFLSYSQPVLNFGLGKNNQADSVKIIWPDNAEKIMLALAANTRHTVERKDGVDRKPLVPVRKALFSKSEAIAFTHIESSYNDFKTESLLENKFSNKGPFMSKGDVNRDGLEDVYVGGSAGQSGKIWIQQPNGTFSPYHSPAFAADARFEDGQSVFFDADQDKDLDLYVTSGSNEFESPEFYGDRLYLNDGKGNFTLGKLPSIKQNNLCVKAEDVDLDGDVDLFVGGHVQPGKFPLCEKSYFLMNQSGIFTQVLCPLRDGNIGIVNDAVFADINQDGYKDLLLAGEWMNLTVLINQKGKFVEKTNDFGLGKSSGWWNCLKACDYDQDGDMDFIAGNRGTNTFFKPKPELPAYLYYSDFDKNGFIDALPFYPYSDKKYYSKHTMDEIFTRLPMIRKLYPRYEEFSKSDMEDMLKRLPSTDVQRLDCFTFQTCLIKNEGNTFTLLPLNEEAQFSFVTDVLAEDLNADGKPDLLLVGNNYGVDVESGKCDASKGLVLLNNGNGFTSLSLSESGFYAPGETRKICYLKNKEQTKILVSRNNSLSLCFELK
jgi:hypothetical protein